MLDNKGGYSLYVLDGSYGSKGTDVCQLVCCISPGADLDQFMRFAQTCQSFSQKIFLECIL